MNIKKISLKIQQRLEDKDWTLYQLAKAYAKYRHPEEDYPASKYHSTISRALENLEASKVITLFDLISVLGGRIEICWDNEQINFSKRQALLTALESQIREDVINELNHDIVSKIIANQLKTIPQQIMDNLQEKL